MLFFSEGTKKLTNKATLWYVPLSLKNVDKVLEVPPVVVRRAVLLLARQMAEARHCRLPLSWEVSQESNSGGRVRLPAGSQWGGGSQRRFNSCWECVCRWLRSCGCSSRSPLCHSPQPEEGQVPRLCQ